VLYYKIVTGDPAMNHKTWVGFGVAAVVPNVFHQNRNVGVLGKIVKGFEQQTRPAPRLDLDSEIRYSHVIAVVGAVEQLPIQREASVDRDNQLAHPAKKVNAVFVVGLVNNDVSTC